MVFRCVHFEIFHHQFVLVHNTVNFLVCPVNYIIALCGAERFGSLSFRSCNLTGSTDLTRKWSCLTAMPQSLSEVSTCTFHSVSFTPENHTLLQMDNLQRTWLLTFLWRHLRFFLIAFNRLLNLTENKMTCMVDFVVLFLESFCIWVVHILLCY